MLLIAGCGGGGAGPTAPSPPANVVGTWKGTGVLTITAGPACLSRQPFTEDATMQISQNGAAISGTFDNCSFHGSVTGASISWAQDAQQTNPACLISIPLPCFNDRNVELIFIRRKTSNLAGTVSGTAITASGSFTDDVVNPQTGQAIGTLQETARLTLQRQ